jgi:hypothetical protein
MGLLYLYSPLFGPGGLNYVSNAYSLTHSLTPQSTVLIEKLTGLQLVKLFPAFYITRNFIVWLAADNGS